MTHEEYFRNKPLSEALAKYNKDVEKGMCLSLYEWLEHTYTDTDLGKFVGGVFYSFDQIEEKLRKMQSVKVKGYLLEWKMEDGSWLGSEFDPANDGIDSNLWKSSKECGIDEASEYWYSNDMQVGFFKELPSKVWLESSDDWKFRLGVDFDSRYTPTQDPRENGVWEGVTTTDGFIPGQKYRVREVTIGGELGDKQKDFIRKFPNVWFAYAAGSKGEAV